MSILEVFHRIVDVIPTLARFAILMALIIIVPQLSRRIRLPSVVGLLLSGVVLGPHVLGVAPAHHPVADFFAELGMLLLMFFAGAEINLPLFQQKIFRSIVFGLVTTSVPLVLGALAARSLGYALIPAIVVGSLLASHTLLALPIITKLRANNLEPVVVAVGATMMSDTLSLLVFAVCVPLYATGFSATGLVIQIAEIVGFIVVVLFGLSRLAGYVLRRTDHDEETYFVLLLGILSVTALLAQLINLPGIVGAFMAGLAVNAAVKDKPAKGKLEFLSHTLFIPVFFVVTGFLIDPVALVRSLSGDTLVARGAVLWSRVRLLAGRAQDYVVIDAPSGSRNACSYACGAEDIQCGRSAIAR
jgi:Kef-type K+ transport system membrane component KefB